MEIGLVARRFSPDAGVWRRIRQLGGPKIYEILPC
jgi:hypothetical protein